MNFFCSSSFLRPLLALFGFASIFCFSACKKESIQGQWFEDLSWPSEDYYAMGQSDTQRIGVGGASFDRGFLLIESISADTWNIYPAPRQLLSVMDHPSIGIIAGGVDGWLGVFNMMSLEWQSVNAPTGYNWNRMCKTPTGQLLVVGGIGERNGYAGLYRAGDWRWEYLPSDLRACACKNDSSLWIAGYGGVWKFDFDATNWVRIRFDEEVISDIFWLDDDVGWISGFAGGIWQTQNGGKDWTRLKRPDAGRRKNLWNAIFFESKDHGWRIGSAGRVQYSSNGGKDWVDVQFSESCDWRVITTSGTKGCVLMAGRAGCIGYLCL